MRVLRQLQHDINKHQRYADTLVMLQGSLQGEPLTVAQRALVETTLNMVAGDSEGCVALYPTFEDYNSGDDLVMESISRTLKLVMETLYRALTMLYRWMRDFITSFTNKASALRREVTLLRKTVDEARNRKLANTSFTVRGKLAGQLTLGDRFALNGSTIIENYGKAKGVAGIVLGGTYTDVMVDLGKRLADYLNAVRTDDPQAVMSKANSTVEAAIASLGFDRNQPTSIALMGDVIVTVKLPKVSSTDPLRRSLEIQRFGLFVEKGSHQANTMEIETLTLDGVAALLTSVDDGLKVVEDFKKSKTADTLLQTAGQLQVQLNKVMQEMDDILDHTSLNDSMVALSRYMTAYAAWVQEPINEYGTYFLDLNAAMLAVSRLSLSQYA